MKEYYLVGIVKEEISVEILGNQIPLKISWADGMIGAIPVFETIEEASKYAGNDTQLMKIQCEKIKEAVDESEILKRCC